MPTYEVKFSASDTFEADDEDAAILMAVDQFQFDVDGVDGFTVTEVKPKQSPARVARQPRALPTTPARPGPSPECLAQGCRQALRASGPDRARAAHNTVF